MSIKIEMARKKAEINRLYAGISENELEILKREDDIERMTRNMEIQKKRIAELEKEMSEMQANGGNE